jgi:hypothetical protein
MTNPRVLLTTLSVRTSAKGRPYLSGWLGKASVVAFEGEPDRWGNPTWDLFLAEPEPRAARPGGHPSPAVAPPRPQEARQRPSGGSPAFSRPGRPDAASSLPAAGRSPLPRPSRA